MKNLKTNLVTDEEFSHLSSFLDSFERISDRSFYHKLKEILDVAEFKHPKTIQHHLKNANKAFYISKGMVIAYYYNDDQEVIPFRIFLKGEIALIPESFMLEETARYSLMAMGNTKLLVISKANVYDLFYHYPQTVRLAIKIISSLFHKDLERDALMGNGHSTALEKFYHQYGDIISGNMMEFRDKYIAAYLHMSPITFSRLKKAFFESENDRHCQMLRSAI
jgi:CRP-like cAMP-binding protein